mmetsp:Transcript_100553/g.138666  ORF Transcript_100553/g.138666 Transcript_100553/m.138666 type:complete len:138 (+) Transcript_100553:258-671(+)|eukprot:CAMPEP_0176380568 /NCGR_PEP_ID=MMETSP0126-20121128/31232_1 /TAXON_ID=141414 ORGANISM="Strombidinopsis acuminatum, Strain SPMC142" /NCGR_SAMPLE_ID=MMETSP0126 /ASSEMBLY_ACC=CAM_ASM_000229 /LENGTH=137 /DNA_ID=CAMNT_0017743963 /DNA_START=257 /DNA_END=670 /DNA_ORIENTATION=+
MRFLESESSDSDIENKLVSLLSELNLTAKVYEYTKELRIDQCIEGRVLSHEELQAPQFVTLIAKKLANLNYSTAACKLANELTGSENTYEQFISCADGSWLATYFNKVKPDMLKVADENATTHPEFYEHVKYFENIF